MAFLDEALNKSKSLFSSFISNLSRPRTKTADESSFVRPVRRTRVSPKPGRKARTDIKGRLTFPEGVGVAVGRTKRGARLLKTLERVETGDLPPVAKAVTTPIRLQQKFGRFALTAEQVAKEKLKPKKEQFKDFKPKYYSLADFEQNFGTPGKVAKTGLDALLESGSGATIVASPRIAIQAAALGGGRQLLSNILARSRGEDVKLTEDVGEAILEAEKTLADLEGYDFALGFGSGMAAITTSVFIGG